MPTPTPRDLAARPRRVPPPPPAPHTPATPAPGWSRARFERSVTAPAGSRLHPYARLVALLLAAVADRDGHIPASRVPAPEQLASDAGIDARRARASLSALDHGGWLVRHRIPGTAGPAALTLTIPPRT
ncbi:hypothetical protein ABZ714_19605 [Streptomyces sp. NPDC006798]|uniref:hypothetical protein n=1 Tax=Streptomyces sp. NPDC006798 TaxID=3155462 RepID=UPI00340BEA8C